MLRIVLSLIIALTLFPRPVSAQQDIAWIQIEAHPSLRIAQDRARLYSGTLPDIAGFSLGGTWYGVLIGPYTRADAQQVLNVYRAQGSIPQDSFLTRTASLGRQFWPIGADILGTDTPPAPTVEPQQETAAAPAQEPEQPAIQTADETPAEARRSESRLTRDERKALQIALQAAGYYNSAIDGAFGRGTRGSMRAWQEANLHEPTGILTTRQRQELMDQYNAPLISVGMRKHVDQQAGIQVQMPMGEVGFARYEPPFAHYDSTGDLGARVLLISQPGDRATLYGLYDIMQTLEIVPLEGPRERRETRFTLEGRGSDIVSYTEARLEKGQIKGFTLIWPVGDEDRRARVLAEMRNSFTRIDGVLDPAAGGDAEQSIDLISGLQVRKPRISRSGFFIDGDGMIVTTTEVIQNCTRITVDDDHEAVLVARDDALGAAILRPQEPLAPIAVAQLRGDVPRLQSDIAVAGFSYGGVLGAPTLTFGTLADIKGLSGETELQRLALAALPGDVGGPVIDVSGGVVGMLLPPPGGGRQLPENVSLAADATALKDLLEQAGVTPEDSTLRGSVPPAELNRIAGGMTVLVSCWD